MESIKSLLLAIVALLLSICLGVIFNGTQMPTFLFIIMILLPIVALFFVVRSFFLDD